MVSAKFAPGGNVDFRLMYAEADDLDVTATALSTDNSGETGADTTLFGVFYALGDSTELSLSYNYRSSFKCIPWIQFCSNE